MFERVQVIGAGRVGSAIAARLVERGLAVGEGSPDVVLLCVPDRAIARRFRRYGHHAGLAFWLVLTRDWADDGAG